MRFNKIIKHYDYLLCVILYFSNSLVFFKKYKLYLANKEFKYEVNMKIG